VGQARAFYTLAATFAARFFTATALPGEAERANYSQHAAALFLNGRPTHGSRMSSPSLPIRVKAPLMIFPGNAFTYLS